MAINIFSGGSRPSKTGVSSSAAERAKATVNALGGAGEAVASSDGTTAVKSSGILGKVGGVLGKIAGVASHAPGIVGAIGGIASKLLSKNDPEWWQTVPGDGLSPNNPLQTVIENPEAPAPTAGTPVKKRGEMRPSILEFCNSSFGGSDPASSQFVLRVTERMATQYLMPPIRTVTNAVVLQSADSYAQVFAAQATLYAMWRCYKKFDYFTKHGHTFLPNTNVDDYPVLQVKNASWLQSTISRLEEYLNANVRLPHTMCEYLSWRFGRTYRFTMAAKSGFVMYNVLPLSANTTVHERLISALMGLISADEAKSKANADLFNAFSSHDQEVLLSDDSQCTYDPKEFMLRTNLDILPGFPDGDQLSVYEGETNNLIYMDSNLDNPTSFMASTVSCLVTNEDGITSALFPVRACRIHGYDTNCATSISSQTGLWLTTYYESYDAQKMPATTGRAMTGTTYLYDPTGDTQEEKGWYHACAMPAVLGSGWWHLDVAPAFFGGTVHSTTSQDPTIDRAASFMFTLMACKACDFYNVGLYVSFGYNPEIPKSMNDEPLRDTDIKDYVKWIDVTSPAYDCAFVPDTIIANENVFAFANLVTDRNKRKESVKTLEKEMAAPVADLVSKTTVASVSAK